MIYLSNLDGNVKLTFDLLNNHSDDFYSTDSDFEKWVPFVLSLSTSTSTITINESMQASLSLYEIKKIYNGFNNILSNNSTHGSKLEHYSGESYFEVKIEYLPDDKCFEVELWFILAETTVGMLSGHDIGFRFTADRSAVKEFAEGFYNSFHKICPQTDL